MNRREFLKHSAAGVAVGGVTAAVAADPVENAPGPQATAAGAAGGWIRPGAGASLPIWGIRGGIQVALWPASVEQPGKGGPRGLLRVGYPILDGGKRVGLVNFIAVEPIVGGRRGFSELERSASDGKPGRLFSTADPAQSGAAPDPGTLHTADGVERLSFRMRTERFDNGAEVLVDIELRADRPGELGLTTTAASGSARMDVCVLTATMGNYGRLRLLWLADGPIPAAKVWPGFDGPEFTPDALFAVDRMRTLPDGDLIVCASSDEADPHAVPPDAAGPNWAYRGSFPLTQYWRTPKGTGGSHGLNVRVNGRRLYWATHNPIPGGIAYENFDLVQPFSDGQMVIFGLTRRTPDEMVERRGEEAGANTAGSA